MIDISDDERRRAFSVWLRTGGLPSLTNAEGLELKFNPWHDPENGRFTFAGAGRRYGPRGSGPPGSEDRSVRQSQPQSRNMAGRATHKDAARTSPSGRAASPKTPTPKPSAQGTWIGGEFTGGGGSFGGAGATGTWRASEPPRAPASAHSSGVAVPPLDHGATTNKTLARPASVRGEQFRTVVRNGYTYQIDSRERTRRVSGVLAVADGPVRSRTSQSRAGGVERRATDDGGHYVAARFNGPTEAFNHFAQDANFNRGRYRMLEEEWARDKRAGKTVAVKIVPRFDGESLRPSVIDVWWTVDGKGRSLKFPNERSERNRGK